MEPFLNGEEKMEYLTEKTWNERKLQYEIGEDWKVKIWSCNAKMRLSKDPCRIEDVNLDEVYGMAIQIIGGGRQTRRTIPASKLEMIEATPKDMAEMLIEDAIARNSMQILVK